MPLNEFLELIINFIRLDIFFGFGIYSITYFISCRCIADKTFITDFDKSAIQTIVYGGIFWFVLWLITVYVYYTGLENGLEKTNYYERLTGKYAYLIWLQPLFWLLLTQLYRILFIKKYLIFRILISLLFVVTFERFVILITSFHRDYLPSTWTLHSDFELSTTTILLGLLARILIFITTVSIYHFGIKKGIAALISKK